MRGKFEDFSPYIRSSQIQRNKYAHNRKKQHNVLHQHLTDNPLPPLSFLLSVSVINQVVQALICEFQESVQCLFSSCIPVSHRILTLRAFNNLRFNPSPNPVKSDCFPEICSTVPPKVIYSPEYMYLPASIKIWSFYVLSFENRSALTVSVRPATSVWVHRCVSV